MPEHQNDFEVHIDKSTKTRTVLIRIADGFGFVCQLQELLKEDRVDWLPDTNGSGGILSLRGTVEQPTEVNDLTSDQLSQLRDMFAQGDFSAIQHLLNSQSAVTQISVDSFDVTHRSAASDLLAFFGFAISASSNSRSPKQVAANDSTETSEPLTEEERLAKVKEIARNPKEAIVRIDAAIGESSKEADQRAARELMLYAQACGRSKADKKAKAIKEKFPDRDQLICELKNIGF